MRFAAATAGAFALVLAGPVSAATASEDCKPKLIAALDMTILPDGTFAVPVMINGAEHKVVIETESPHSVINGPFATQAGLAMKPVPNRLTIGMHGALVTSFVRVPSFGIGSSTGADIAMLVDPMGDPVRDDIVGSIGMDLLANFDLDMDFKARKMNVFSSNPCEGAGVYWSKTYAELPLDLDAARTNTEMTLDGKAVSVTLSTGSPVSAMAANVAQGVFGNVPDGSSPGASNSMQHQASFNVLEGGGLSVSHPAIFVFGDPKAPLCDGHRHTKFVGAGMGMEMRTACYSNAQLTLGMRELKRLHLYFAFKAGKLYFTGADAN